MGSRVGEGRVVSEMPRPSGRVSEKASEGVDILGEGSEGRVSVGETSSLGAGERIFLTSTSSTIS